MGPYKKEMNSTAIDDGWTIEDGDGHVIAHLDTEAEADGLLAYLRGELVPMPKCKKKKPGKVKKGVRAFVGSFFVCIDENETESGDVEREAVKEYLAEAGIVDVDMEEHGNPVGFQSMEVFWDSLRELTEEEMGLYYGKRK